MKRMVERRQLALDATDAAALVLDWSRDPEWRSAVSSIEVEPAGRARPGQGIRETLRFAGFRFVTPSAITGADASSASFAGASGTVAVSGRRTVVADEEGCTVVLELEVAMTGAMAFLERLLAPAYRRRFAAEADALVALGGATGATRRRQPLA